MKSINLESIVKVVVVSFIVLALLVVTFDVITNGAKMM